MGTDAVELGIEGDLATVTLNRAESLNAQTPSMWRQLSQFGSSLPGNVRVVVVRGRGRSFSAGLDRSMFTASGIPGEPSLRELAGPAGLDQIAGFQGAFAWLARADLISIAAVQGHAVGAGFQLALACDLRVLTDDAQLSMAEVPLGLVPDLGGTRRLLELVGYSRAMDLCLTGRRVSATEATALGLASRVVADDQLDTGVAEVAAAILRAPRNSVIEAKALLLAAAHASQTAQEQSERAAQHRLLRELAGHEDS